MMVPALLYHHVGPHAADARYSSLSISAGQLDRQMRWLVQNGYTSIRPAEWLAWRREGRSLRPKPVLLPFDDGYADFPEHALPVLQRWGFGAVVFVITGRIGGANLWDGAPL